MKPGEAAWRSWVASNLQRGVSRATLLERLLQREFDVKGALRLLDEATMPAAEATAQLVTQGRTGISFARAPAMITWPGFVDAAALAPLLEAAELGLQPGHIADAVQNSAVRDNQVKWLDLPAMVPGLANKLRDAVLEINRLHFLFNITEPLGKGQLTMYDKGGHYAFHQDVGRGASKMRKLSCVLQLSEDRCYAGGDLELFYTTKPKAMPRALGSLIVFPSYILHRVMEVTEGRRLALVWWALGPPFC